MSKKVNRAGVIPYIIERGVIKMMFMVPSDAKYGGAVPQIAKGKQEKGETPLEAGLREASEELGLFEGNVVETYDLGMFMGRTSIYITKIKDKKMFGDPCDETSEVKWLTAEQFEKEGRDLHKPIIKAALRLIKDKEGYDERYNLLESLGTRQNLKWTQTISPQGGTQLDAKFSINDEDYNITLLYNTLDLPTRSVELVEVSFQRIINNKPEIKLTNSKYISKVLGTIYNAVVDKLHLDRTDIIVLAAKDINDESNLKIRHQRISLYSNIAHRVTEHGVYRVEPGTFKSKHATNIILIKNDKNPVKLTPKELEYIKNNI